TKPGIRVPDQLRREVPARPSMAKRRTATRGGPEASCQKVAQLRNVVHAALEIDSCWRFLDPTRAVERLVTSAPNALGAIGFQVDDHPMGARKMWLLRVGRSLRVRGRGGGECIRLHAIAE